ncbi:Hypothetical predicted protein [Mytilus galloprovincialis]|uniref:Uncharacterized protein n=1 Tax=Mytilus galloprovincialis TaxID=29158 RepID=A0A8B6HJY2_MYTGA|nr:Hypothetical predicted protein [Mytilus galloprovincialis]
MGTMNSPGLSLTSFSAIEQEVGEWGLAALQENMLQYIAPTQPGKKTTTGRNKKNTAKQNNEFVSEANIEPSADQTPSTRSRRDRPRLVKFLDKRIEHKWIVDNTSEWYKGTVLRVKSGKDGVKACQKLHVDASTASLCKSQLGLSFQACQELHADASTASLCKSQLWLSFQGKVWRTFLRFIKSCMLILSLLHATNTSS